MVDSEQSKQSGSADSRSGRRSFFAMLAGGVAMLVPLGAGVVTFLSPLFRKSKPPEVRVALLSQVPDDGKAYAFPVVTDRTDAWTHYAKQKVGSVYLVRQPGEETPTAFTAKCPHAGCSIGYSAEEELFKCPCHTSSFKLDGCRARGDDEVSPRDMDTLEVTLRPLEGTNGETATEVRVKFVDFQTGHKEKIPSA